jgi:ADP-ribose pyrophosphatase
MKVINRKSLWKGQFIETIAISYEDHKGVLREWEAVSRLNTKGVVVIIPITEEKELILIKQFRPALDRYVIELPAGLVEYHEDYIAAGKRELIEETGYSSENLLILTDGVMSTGINAEIWKIVIARNVEKVSQEVLAKHSLDENEDIEVLKVPLDSIFTELENFKINGVVIDLRIYGLIELAKRKLNITSKDEKI